MNIEHSGQRQCHVKSKRTDITVGNIVIGDDNVIIDNTNKTFSSQQTANRIQDDKNGTGSTTISGKNIICGKRNKIIKGDPIQESINRPCTPSVNEGAVSQSGDFLKKQDDKDFIRNRRIVSKASKSVGIVRGPNGGGTAFRVGEKYVMTALHVVTENIKDLQNPNDKALDYTKVKDKDFFIQFEFLKPNQRPDAQYIFNFKDLVYKNKELDTAILELQDEPGKTFPPSINIFAPLQDGRPVYLIGHPNGQPLMDDPKIEICDYDLSLEKVKTSIQWANKKLGNDIPHYEGIDDRKKILFHCASQHGASGAVGVMVTPHYEEPIGVLMLLKGYPSFYYSRHLLFSETDKENFFRVEQGVLLKSIEKDMDSDLEQPPRPKLKNEIFSQSLK